MSGGVDSSVSAHLLKKQGFNVVGVFIKTWQPEWLDCNWRSERIHAMRAAAHLGIPFKTADLSKEYKKSVIEYMVNEYKTGRTPNPDVMCNKEIKFGAFYRWAMNNGANMIATGHYARVSTTSNHSELLKSIDQDKDQTYFLWNLNQDTLKHVLFPIGHMRKSQVRHVAEKIGLPNALKKDSQGLCFVGKIDIKQFLTRYIDAKQGNVIDTFGNIIGHHPGAIMFTIGERHGFTVTHKSSEDMPFYVISKDIENNTITVSHDPSPVISGEILSICNANWINHEPKMGVEYEAQIRYRDRPFRCTVMNVAADRAEVSMANCDDLPASGQSLVLYKGNICLGGGIIV